MRSHVQALLACNLLLVVIGMTKNNLSGCTSCAGNATWVQPASGLYDEKSQQESYDAAVRTRQVRESDLPVRALPPPESSANRIQAALTDGIQQLVQEVEGIASRTGLLHEQAQDLSTRVTSQDRQFIAQSRQVQDLINRMLEKDKQAKVHSERIAVGDERLGSLSNRMAAKDEQITGHVHQVKMLFDRMDAKDQQIAEKDEQILILRNQTSALEHQLAAMATEVQQLRSVTEHTKHRGEQFMMYGPLALLIVLVPSLCCIAG